MSDLTSVSNGTRMPGPLLPGSIFLADSVSTAMAALSNSREEGTCVGDLTKNS